MIFGYVVSGPKLVALNKKYYTYQNRIDNCQYGDNQYDYSLFAGFAVSHT
nr:MAG TPA: hypothetical protein [Caudoviricetes sp.]